MWATLFPDTVRAAVLDYVEGVYEVDPARIEHFQHPTRAAIAAAAESGIIASMQPYHAIDDGRWAEGVIGAERARTTYAFKSLIDSGAHLALGSDWYVAPADPIAGIYAAVTRRTLEGRNPGGWVPEQKITVEQALGGYTLEGAYASFEEHDKGSLAPGKLADFVILEKDPRKVDPDSIKQIKVLETSFGDASRVIAHWGVGARELLGK